MVHHTAMIRHAISMIRHTISMIRHISMVRHITMISHSCAMVFHVAMAHHTLGCALPILSPTVVDAVHIVGSNVWNGLPQVVEGFFRKRICNLNRVCSGRHKFLTRTNPVHTIEVEAGFSLKSDSNGSLLVLKLNFQNASFACLDSSYCVSPAFLDVVYVREVAQFSHVVGRAVVWQFHPLLSSDSIILALRSVRRARFEAVLVVVAVGLLHVDATVLAIIRQAIAAIHKKVIPRLFG